MAIKGVDTKCYILALFVRDDGERFLLGSGHYEFKDTQMHFAANAIQNDIVEVQGNDGFLLAGQVRRPGTQSFDGYVGDGTMSKEETESYRRQFFSFFRKNFFYKVIYVFSDGTAIQRKSGFLVDDPTVEELYQMYPEYHVALNFEDVNYYSYSEDEEGQEQYAKEATIDTSSMRATGGLVWDNLGVVWEDTQWGGEQTASGTEITIQNEMSVMSIVDDIRLDGDTDQQTYSGKNLFNINTVPTWIGGDTTYSVSGNTFHVEGKWFIGIRMNVEQSTDYYVSATRKNLSSASASGNISIYELNQSTSIRTLGKENGTFNSGNRTGVFIVFYCGSGTEGNYADFENIQIEKGTSQTSYEPYVGGIPSPNPDYPQDVQVVTGEQTVEVHGKNLFDKVAEVATSPNYSLNPNGTITTNASNAQTGRRYMTLTMSPGTYTLSFRPYFSGVQKPAIRFTIRNMDTSTDYVVKNINNPENGAVQVNSFTVENTTSVGFCIIPQARLEDGQTFYFYDTQLEQGSATAYEPYQSQSYTINLGSIELCKIGNYRDNIFNNDPNEDWYNPDLEDNAWYMHKAVRHLQLPISGMNNSDSNPGWINQTQLKADLGTTSGGQIYTDTTMVTNIAGLVTSESRSVTKNFNGNNALLLLPTDYYGNDHTQTYWKTNYADLVVDFYYGINGTIIDTQITDATLVGQLNALSAMKLFISENNLTIQATGTNLPAPLSFKYYTTVSMTGAEWEEGGSGGATVVEVDSITNTYPIWRVKGPAVDPQLSVINTNTTIRYTGTVTSTQTLEIDMFNKTAKLNGVSVIGNVSGDWVSLAPGTNRVIYTAENADAQPSTIEWQEVVG